MSFSNLNTSDNDINTINNHERKRNLGYTKRDKWIIISTILITILGILLRSWRVIREGMPLAFDGYHFQKYAKIVFNNGWIDFNDIIRDPPGIDFILVIAENLLGLPAEPIMWSIFVFPQIIASLQLIIFFILARRLTKSRTIGLLSMFIMSFIGLIVYRNQNVAPETFILGLVPYTVFFIFRYLETNDLRFLIVGVLITIGIIFIHHLSTLFALLNWHFLIIYDIIYRKVKEKKKDIKGIFIKIGSLIFLDIITTLFWVYVLKGFPFDFTGKTLRSFSEYLDPTFSSILLLVGIIIMVSIVFLYLFFNFDKKQIKIGIVVTGSVGIVIVFIMAMFFGAASPDSTIIAGLLAGTPILVLAPFGSGGLVSLPKLSNRETRMIRGWLFSLIFFLCGVAIIPIMSSILGRLALYLIPIGVLLAVIAFVKIINKMKLQKIKAIILVSLIGWTTITMTYAYPKPRNNWGQQEIYWDAEFSTIDFLDDFSNAPENTVWIENWPIEIDCDFRLGLVVEGYSGFESTLGRRGDSWLTQVLYLDSNELSNFASNSSPREFNVRIDYVMISTPMYQDGYLTNWANYGTDISGFVLTLPKIDSYLTLNPHLHRIYDNNISYLIYPKIT